MSQTAIMAGREVPEGRPIIAKGFSPGTAATAPRKCPFWAA